MTPPEAALWLRLRARREGRPTFRRQHAVGPFILDFYCASLRLAIEVDGQIHDLGDNPDRDVRRTAWLKAYGIDVIRLPAVDILRNTDEVAESVWLLVRKRARRE